MQLVSGASGNTIGGTAAGAANVIADNAQETLYGSVDANLDIEGVGTSNNVVLGNFIGTNAQGTTVLNVPNGIEVFVGSGAPPTPSAEPPRAPATRSPGARATSRLMARGRPADVFGGELHRHCRQRQYWPWAIRATAWRSHGTASGNTIGGTASGAGNTIGNDAVGVLYYEIDIGVGINKSFATYGQRSRRKPYRHRRQRLTNPFNQGDRASSLNLGDLGRSRWQATAPARQHNRGKYGYRRRHHRLRDDGQRGRGNFIGTNASGATGLGNSGFGVYITYGATGTPSAAPPRHGNTIASNTRVSNSITPTEFPFTTGNVIQGNYIGTNASGATGLGNVFDGVAILSGSAFTTVGGTTPGAGNIDHE